MNTIDSLIPARERFLKYVNARVSDTALAEDIVQDSLLKALKSAPTIRDEDRLIPWFYRVLHNAVVDTYRSKNSSLNTIEMSAADDVAISESEELELCDCFRELLPTINPDYAALIESDISGKYESLNDEAEILGIAPNNLKVRRHRARQALKTRLEETCRTCTEHACLDCTCSASPESSHTEH